MQLIQAGIHPELPPRIERRVLLINKLALSISFLCLALVIISVVFDLNSSLALFFANNSLFYLVPILLHHYRQYIASLIFGLLYSNFVLVSFGVFFGLDIQIQLLFPIVSASVFIFLTKNNPLKLFLAILPAFMWLGMHYYCSTHSPWISLEPSVILFMAYTNQFQLFFWTILFLYYFSSLTEDYVLKVEAQKKQVFLKNKQLEQFNYIATHELKTPIANIEGFYNLLHLELAQPTQEIEELLDGLQRGIQQAKNIFLDLIRVINKMTVIEEVNEVYLAPILEELKDSFQKEIQQKGAQIHTNFSNCPSLYFGKKGIHHILNNLLGNALKYSSPHRPPIIHIKSQIQDNFIVLSVQDNGIGINLEQQRQKLFGLFKKLHHNVDGSGVGLFLIKQLVESNGGYIDVQSEPTKGSTFSIFLPKISIL